LNDILVNVDKLQGKMGMFYKGVIIG